MQNTLNIYNQRKTEIDLYFVAMNKFDNGELIIPDVNRFDFFRIMKSNFILMLYNIIEACIVAGMCDIFEQISNESASYDEVTNEIKTIWSNHEISKMYTSQSGKNAYQKKVQCIISYILKHEPLKLDKEVLEISGNLDAKKIKELCARYKISHHASDKNGSLYKVKLMRNDLAHGNKSFCDCARDMTMSDLSQAKNDTLSFLAAIMKGMSKYCDEKQFKNTI